MPKELPIDISAFEKLIKSNCIYVDKTRHIYDLFKGSGHYYFLSRPRRFGKSLLISTLKEVFSGKKELFRELKIEKTDWAWQQHPIIYLDFGTIAHQNSEDLKQSLHHRLDIIAHDYKVQLVPGLTLEDKLTSLVTALNTLNTVVLLIDEYDKPLIDHIIDLDMAEKNRNVLKSFYDCVKGLDEYFRAIFITGVSKFSKVTIFSGLNNLNDISEDPLAATLLGYTQEELEYYFIDYIKAYGKITGTEKSMVLDTMKQFYNGYRFSKLEIRVYNPFSTGYFLHKQEFANYWAKSGNPAFLIKLLKARYESMDDLTNITVKADNLGPFDVDNIPLIPLLYQAGYLTIKDAFYEGVKLYFKLDYPNHEIREYFTEHLIASMTNLDSSKVDGLLRRIKQSLVDCDITKLCTVLRSLLANIPYYLHIPKESYYHSLFQLIFQLMGADVHSEVATSQGRIDTVIMMKTRIYLFEFKFDDAGPVALAQIIDRRYYEKYLGLGKPIIAVGIAFNYQDKMLRLDWVEKEITNQEMP